MRSRLMTSSTVALLAAAAAPALGQQSQQQPRASAEASTPAQGRSAQLGSTTAGPGPLADVRQRMFDDGGSLLQATTAPPDAAADAGTGRVPTYSLYAVADPEPHVLKKHDLVNIVVREESKSASGGTSDQQRQVDFDAKVDAFVRFKAASLSVYPLRNQLPEVKAEGERSFKGQGEYDRVDTMVTRLEAEVIDVKPNGSLVLQARRHMQVDEETVDVTLTGVCRVKDVDATNSVISTDMHDLNLRKVTTGQVHDTTKRGLLHQALDFLNPF